MSSSESLSTPITFGTVSEDFPISDLEKLRTYFLEHTRDLQCGAGEVLAHGLSTPDVLVLNAKIENGRLAYHDFPDGSVYTKESARACLKHLRWKLLSQDQEIIQAKLKLLRPGNEPHALWLLFSTCKCASMARLLRTADNLLGTSFATDKLV